MDPSSLALPKTYSTEGASSLAVANTAWANYLNWVEAYGSNSLIDSKMP